MAVPQTQKKVGAGGCIVSLVFLALSIIIPIVGIFWGLSGVVSIANDLNSSSTAGVGLGQTGTINVNTAGTQWLVLGNNSSGTLPISNPKVTVTDPSGNNVTVNTSSAVTSSGSSSGTTFRSLGTFNAATTGSYEVSVGGSESSFSSGTKVFVLGFDIDGMISQMAIGIGGGIAAGVLFFIIACILGIVWLVRRSKNNKPQSPPYQGGGGYAPGPPGGYGAPPPGPAGPPGGYGAPPQVPPPVPPPGPAGPPPGPSSF